MKLHNNIYGLLTATLLTGSLISCSDAGMEAPVERGTTTDASPITFTVSLESQQAATRADGYESTYTDWFSDGSHADKLIFAVYKKDNTSGEYSLDNSFNKTGQTNSNNQNEIKNVTFPFSIQLIPEAGAEYKVVFWAQNSECDAFDTSDLTSIEINYEKLPMNDERSDVFSAVAEFNGSNLTTKEVILKRPLAQINVGTSGWDYEGKAILKPNPEVIKYSTMTVKGVAKKFNALSNEVIKEDEPINVTFAWNIIPAYRRYVAGNGDLSNITDEYIKTLSNYLFNKEKNPAPSFDIVETYLDVDLVPNQEYGYIGWYQYKKNTDDLIKEVNQGNISYSTDEDLTDLLNGKIITEKFKYLATCYVLIAGTKQNDTDNDATYSTTVKVEFQCAEKSGDVSGTADSNNVFSFTMPNVPVNRNWRTNIVSAAGSGLFMETAQFRVDVYPEYVGDFYKRLASTDNNWSDNGNTQGGGDNNDYEDNYPKDDYPDNNSSQD
ncbi:MAG: hypothetical protein J1E78_05030 [Muribaculaceae bacterium]|nr:hypothetical protein [Muribaculaceae bacterium]